MARVLIIGGGVAGLTAGIYARKYGHEAVIIERHVTAGGNLTGWKRGGYLIDNCVHWLTGTNPASSEYKIWCENGALGDVEIRRSDSLYTCEVAGERLSLYRDLDRVERRMLAISPEDEREIRSFTKAVRDIQGFIGIAGESHSQKSSLFAKICAIPTVAKYFKLTTGDLGRRFSHPLLREFFSSFFTDRFGAFALLFVIAHYCGDNADLPAGGSVAMAKRMKDRFLSLGGELLLGREAVKVNLEGSRATSVRLADGSELSADYVILTTDPATTFGKLIDREMPRELKAKYKDHRLMRFSSYQCAFKCDLPTVPFESDICFDLPYKYRVRLCTMNLVVREFSHEPSFSPDGCNILQTMTFCDERMARRFIEKRASDKADYDRRKRYLGEWIRRAMIEKMPELDGHIELIDVWTPASYRRFVGSDIGSYMSFVFSKNVAPLASGSRIKGLKNVLLATQWQQAPGGLPIAAELGKRAAELINKLAKPSRKAKCPT